MLKTIPTPAMLEELLGPALYAAWQALCQAIEERYDMEPCGTPAAKAGPTSTNTAGAARPCVPFTPKASAWDS